MRLIKKTHYLFFNIIKELVSKIYFYFVNNSKSINKEKLINYQDFIVTITTVITGVVEVVGCIIAILTIYFSFFYLPPLRLSTYIHDNIFGSNQIFISEYKSYVSLSDKQFPSGYDIYQYKINSEQEEVLIFFGEQEEIYEYQKEKSYFDRGCLIDFYFENKSEMNNIISEFTLNIKNIAVIKIPDIYFYSIVEDNKYKIFVVNNGWGDAHNVKVHIVDSEGELYKIYDNKSYNFIFATIPAAERTEVFCIDVNDKSDKYVFHNEGYEPILEIEYSYDEVNGIQSDSIVSAFFSENSISPIGIGGDYIDPITFAIIVPTENESTTKSYRTNYEIKSRSITQLPVYFLPDKSSEIIFNVEFEINNERKIVSNDFRMIFKVPALYSIAESGESYDVNNDYVNGCRLYFPYK